MGRPYTNPLTLQQRQEFDQQQTQPKQLGRSGDDDDDDDDYDYVPPSRRVRDLFTNEFVAL